MTKPKDKPLQRERKEAKRLMGTELTMAQVDIFRVLRLESIVLGRCLCAHDDGHHNKDGECIFGCHASRSWTNGLGERGVDSPTCRRPTAEEIKEAKQRLEIEKTKRQLAGRLVDGLPMELLRALSDPSVKIPGEQRALQKVLDWVMDYTKPATTIEQRLSHAKQVGEAMAHRCLCDYASNPDNFPKGLRSLTEFVPSAARAVLFAHCTWTPTEAEQIAAAEAAEASVKVTLAVAEAFVGRSKG